MAKVSVSAAAKLAGISRAGFYKNYINTGVITVEKNINSRPEVDTSELVRVFGEIKGDTVDTPERHKLTHEKASKDSALQVEVRMLHEQLAEAKEREQWLKQKIDSLSSTNNFLLENKQPKKKRFWLF